MSFVFYDTETTGIDTSFDQVLQFAAIRTDADLNELDRFDIRCRLHGHMAPSPGAMRVTGVTVAQLTDPALPSHYQMVRAIRDKLLSWSPAIFAGYNSMDFDEALLRQALYQTLHPPYLTQSKGNCRADVLELAQCTALFSPGVLTIPTGDKGKPIFKLDRVAPTNGFNHENAHDALADVEATIHLCRLIRDGAPDAWSNFTRFAQKAAVADFVTEESAFLLTEHFFNKPCPYVVSLIEFDEEQSSLAYVWDLGTDLQALSALDDKKLAAKLKGSPKPIRRLKINSAPQLMHLDDIPEHLHGRLPSQQMVEAQLAWLNNNKHFVAHALTVYRSVQKEYEPAIHVEKMIYDGFLESGDTALLEEFHKAPWEDRDAVLGRLSDERYKMLGRRLIYAERPDALLPEMRAELEAEFAIRLRGTAEGGEPWLTLPEALLQTNDLLQSATGDEHALLSDLADYLTERLESLSPC
ncbi:MAG: hypothetical protein JNL81_17405 [Hyphomonadaceae bacterium]|nr:hypothetical protein [Hyphomonadaceae bacterium]